MAAAVVVVWVMPCRLLSQVEGDLLLGDMGQGLPLRTGCFDGAISISALQVGGDKRRHGIPFFVNHLCWPCGGQHSK
jgi:hypothetical protein